jgi:hypothetical protein
LQLASSSTLTLLHKWRREKNVKWTSNEDSSWILENQIKDVPINSPGDFYRRVFFAVYYKRFLFEALVQSQAGVPKVNDSRGESFGPLA